MSSRPTQMFLPRSTCTASLLLASAALLQGCAQVDAGLQKAVVIKYAHVANVRSFQAPVNKHQSLITGVDPGGFWAVFDLCSLDVQGKALSDFKYESGRFYADIGGVHVGADTPGTVNVASVPMSSNNPDLLEATAATFHLSPGSQTFPRQFYPTLKYRIAFYINSNPPGYHDDLISLQYAGQPQVAAIVQPATPAKPVRVDFLPGAATPLPTTCP